jgi:FkbM family methyltransferase
MSDNDPSYAAKLTALLRRSPVSPPTFIDGGACRGDFTATLVAEFPDATIHAFEPDPEYSRRTAERFSGLPNIRVWNVALHEHTSGGELLVHADRGTSSLLPRPSDERRYYPSSDCVVATIPVATTTLDGFISSRAQSRVNLLKLDTQGSELSILRGAQHALQSAAIEVIYTEFFIVPHYAGAPLLGDLIGFLARFEYSLFDLFKGPNAANGQLRFGDAIFVSPEFRARHLDTSPDEA